MPDMRDSRSTSPSGLDAASLGPGDLAFSLGDYRQARALGWGARTSAYDTLTLVLGAASTLLYVLAFALAI